MKTSGTQFAVKNITEASMPSISLKKSLRPWLVTVFVCLSIYWTPVHAGGDGSGGGSGIAYYLPNQPQNLINLTKVVSTDVYRTTHEFVDKFQIHIDPFFLQEDEVRDQEAVEARSEVLLGELLNRLKVYSPMFVARLMKARNLLENWTSIRENETLSIKNDFGPPFTLENPGQMKMVQIILRKTDILIKDDNYYKKMNALNRASIKFHELAYAASGHATSYYIQMLFAHIVGGKLKGLSQLEFTKLMQKLFNLQYQNSENNSKRIELPLGVTLVKDSDENTTDSFSNLAKVVNNIYGDGSRVSEFASEDAVCGELTNIDYEKHELSFKYRHKNFIAIDGVKFSGDDSATYEIPPEKWQQFDQAVENTSKFLEANYPNYMSPASFIKSDSVICISTNFMNGFDHIEYLEIQFGRSKSEAANATKQAELTIALIKNAQAIELINKEIEGLVQIRDAISSDTQKQRQSRYKYTSMIAELIAKKSSLGFSSIEQESRLEFSSVRSLADFETIRTIGLKFEN